MAKKDNYDSVMQLLGRKRGTAPETSGEVPVSVEEMKDLVAVETIKVSPTNEFIQLQNKEFNYSLLERDLSEKLQAKESALKNIFANAYTKMGEVLKEAQDLLASHNKNVGIFETWYNSLGFKKDTVYRLISRFDLLANCEKTERGLIESIPLSLAYELAKFNCPESLKQAVLAGEIKTLKEFKERQNELSLSGGRNALPKTYTKKDIQLKKARLLEVFNEFQKKSNLMTSDHETLASLISLLNKAEHTIGSINEMLE